MLPLHQRCVQNLSDFFGLSKFAVATTDISRRRILSCELHDAHRTGACQKNAPEQGRKAVSVMWASSDAVTRGSTGYLLGVATTTHRGGPESLTFLMSVRKLIRQLPAS